MPYADYYVDAHLARNNEYLHNYAIIFRISAQAGIFPNTQLHQAPEEGEESDIVWRAAAIAKEIGRTERQAFHRCSKGHLPVTKVGGHWVGSRRRLRRHVIGEDA